MAARDRLDGERHSSDPPAVVAVVAARILVGRLDHRPRFSSSRRGLVWGA